MDIKPIRTKRDHTRAVRQIEELWDAKPGSADDDRLDVLATLVDRYEEEHFPIELPDPVEAIKFRLEQAGLTAVALESVLDCSRARVWEIMHGKRELSMAMVRALHEKLGIPLESLVGTSRRRAG